MKTWKGNNIMFNQAVNLSEEFLTIEFTKEDLFNAFMENGVEFNSENVSKFLTKDNIKILENECIAKSEEILGQLVSNTRF